MIKVYSTKSCSYCIKLKDWLKERNIEYQELIVGQDVDSDFIIEKTGQMGVPVTEINGEFIVGFRPEEIKKRL